MFFCGTCGTVVRGEVNTCPKCSGSLSPTYVASAAKPARAQAQAPPAALPSPAPLSPAPFAGMPTGSWPPDPSAGMPPAAWPPASPVGMPLYLGNDPKAGWSLGLGIASFFCLGVFASIPAVILGHLARTSIRRSGGRMGGAGMALAGLILGYVVTVLHIAIFTVYFGLIVAAVGAQSARHPVGRETVSRKAITEPTVNLRTLNSALAVYKQKYRSYPLNLRALGPNGTEKGTAEAADLVDLSLAVGIKDDYFFTYERSGPETTSEQGYVLRATPFTTNPSSRAKSYYSDQTGVVREVVKEP